MNSFEAKRAARKLRQQARADRLAAESTAAFDAARRSIEHIPPGQPILVGHHSERRHRRDLARHDRLMDKGIAAYRAAEEARRQASTESTAISADDPDALAKLREKIAELKAKQALFREINRVHAHFLKSPEAPKTVAAIAALPEPWQFAVRNYVPRYSWEPHPIAPYQFQNLGGNLRRYKERLEQLEKQRAAAPQPDIVGTIGGLRVSVIENAQANRLQIVFSGKPSSEVRQTLKQSGFRWAPSEGAWQMQLHNRARWLARSALGLDAEDRAVNQ